MNSPIFINMYGKIHQNTRGLVHLSFHCTYKKRIKHSLNNENLWFGNFEHCNFRVENLNLEGNRSPRIEFALDILSLTEKHRFPYSVWEQAPRLQTFFMLISTEYEMSSVHKN